MAKLVVLLLSGPKERRRVITGFKFAKMSKESGEFDDVSLIISAEAVEIFKDDSFSDVINEARPVLPVKACKMNAEGAGVTNAVNSYGIPLAPVGKELIRMIKEGYEVISF